MFRLSKEAAPLDNMGEGIVAVLASTLVAGVTGISAVFASMLLGQFLFRVELVTDEVASWSAIIPGVPIGIVCAAIAFIYCFRKIRAYGRPS